MSFCRCAHYRRRCRIRAPCCNEIFDCRHCHNEIKARNYILSVILDLVLSIISYSWLINLFFFNFLLQNSICVDQKERHEIPRHEVNQVQLPTGHLSILFNLFTLSEVSELKYLFKFTYTFVLSGYMLTLWNWTGGVCVILLFKFCIIG